MVKSKLKIAKYIFKTGLFSLMYTLIMCPVGILILLLDEKYWYFITLLGIVALGFYAMLIFVYYKSVGAEEMKATYSNKALYDNIDRLDNGTRIEYEKEFSAYKGILYGLIAVIPLIIFIIIYGILDGCNLPLYKTVYDASQEKNVDKLTAFGSFGGIIKILYSLYYTPFAPIAFFGSEAMKNSVIYFMLIGIPFSMISTFVPYLYGAYSAKKQLNFMNETSQYIYGGKNVQNPALEHEKELKKDPKKWQRYLKQKEKAEKKNKRRK